MGLEGLSIGHLLVVLLVAVLVFGTKRIRTVGSDLGHAIRGFKQAMREGEEAEAAPAAAAPEPVSMLTDARPSAESSAAKEPHLTREH